ncbi:hypothetical protein ACIA8G_10510 [Lentzea sp. NPDC051213]|uniref:hypothetical protein n=1 Tax=Lentzea sp. NPDC051213 TaxID=3364126 RepID=UPI0037995264
MGTALVIVDMQDVLIPVVWRGPQLAGRIGARANRLLSTAIHPGGTIQVRPPAGIFA